MSSKAANIIAPFTGIGLALKKKEDAKKKAVIARDKLAESERLREELEESSAEAAEQASITLASEQATLSPEEKEASKGLRQTKPTIRKSLLSEYATKRTTSLL